MVTDVALREAAKGRGRAYGTKESASSRDYETKRLLDEYKIMQACFEWFEEGRRFVCF